MQSSEKRVFKRRCPNRTGRITVLQTPIVNVDICSTYSSFSEAHASRERGEPGALAPGWA